MPLNIFIIRRGCFFSEVLFSKTSGFKRSKLGNFPLSKSFFFVLFFTDVFWSLYSSGVSFGLFKDFFFWVGGLQGWR